LNWEVYLKAMLPDGKIGTLEEFLFDIIEEVVPIPGLGLTSYFGKGASLKYGWLNAHERARERLPIGRRTQLEIRRGEQSVTDEIITTKDVVIE
jgi:hypothetical protein